VAKTAKVENIKYIFLKVWPVEIIADDCYGNRRATLVLDPIEGLTKDEIVAGQNYFTIEENNLKIYNRVAMPKVDHHKNIIE